MKIRKLNQIKKMNSINKSLEYIKIGTIKCMSVSSIHSWRYLLRNILTFGNLYRDEFISLSYNVKYFNNRGHKMRFVDLTKNDIAERSIGEENKLSSYVSTNDINYLNKARVRFKYDLETRHFNYGNDVLSIYRRKIYKNYMMLKHRCHIFK